MYIQQQYQNASSALTQNQQTIAEHYGQALVNSMGEASTQMNSVIGNMIGNAQSHIDAFNEAIESGSMGAWKDYMDGVSALTNASGLTYDNLIANADDYKQVADDANKAAQDLIKTFKDSFEDVNSATEEWDAHLATLTGVQTMYENIATSAQNALTVLSGFTAGEGVGDTSAAIAAMLGLTATTQNGAPTSGSSKPPLGDSTNNLVEGAPELLDGIPELMSGIPEINAALMAGIPEMYEELMAGIPEMYAELMAGIPEMNEELISGIPEVEEQLTSAITEVLADPTLTDELRAKKLDEYNVLIDKLAKYEEAQKEMELEKLAGKVGSAGGGGGTARTPTAELIEHAALTNQEMQMVEEMLLMQMQSFYAAQASVLGGGGGSNISIDKGSNLEQMIEIKADFPNATDQNEIKAAFEELINLASQHAYSSAAVQKSY